MNLSSFLPKQMHKWSTLMSHHTITNLTPGQLPRNASGAYRFEAAWDSNQKSVKQETIRGYLVMDGVQYPMTPVPIARDRWEVVAPLESGTRQQRYYYKFDYDYDSYPEPKPNSQRTDPFILEIVEPNQY